MISSKYIFQLIYYGLLYNKTKYEKKIQKNIFEKNIYKKYFQYPSVIPFWNRETQSNAMALIEK